MSESPKLFKPSNNTDGERFFDSWCRKCARDKSMSEGKSIDDCAEFELCDIIVSSMIYQLDEAEYPRQWIYGENGPCCTSFVPVGEEVKHVCTNTLDLFGSSDTTLRTSINEPLPIDSEGGHCD